MLSPGSRRTSHTRTCSFSNSSRWPTSPSAMPRSAAALRPYLSVICILAGPNSSFRHDGNRIDLDEVVGRHHLGHLDHCGGRQRRFEILTPDLVNRLEVLNVADVDVDPAHVVERAPGGL